MILDCAACTSWKEDSAVFSKLPVKVQRIIEQRRMAYGPGIVPGPGLDLLQAVLQGVFVDEQLVSRPADRAFLIVIDFKQLHSLGKLLINKKNKKIYKKKKIKRKEKRKKKKRKI